MEKYISNYTGEQIDALLSQIQSNVSQADLDALKAELVLRLQGSSSSQDGYKDPVFYKEFVGSATLDDMNTWLNNQFFAIKDGVYYRNEQSGSYAISKDVPQCLINLSYQGVKIYIYNAPRTFSTGTFEQFAIGAAVSGNNITWGSGIYRRKSTYNFSTKQVTWSDWESLTSSSASEEYVDEQIELLAKQRTSFVTPCFSDCDSTHEAKCKSITLAGGELGFGFKSIFSVTIKIAESLSLLNQTSTYLHIKDLFGNSIGVSMNGVKQMLNLGKYVTWFFDSVINTSGGPIVLSLHTTNVASSASDSNLVKIIAHVNQSEGMTGCNITDENGTSHTNWTPALGINIVNLSAIYPQIKELQKYRMAYATSELPDISTTGHKANIKEIRINQNVMGISLVNSVSIMVASDSAYSGALELRVYDINSNLIATSNNTVNLSQNLGKYVTWYFTPFQLNTDAIYKFSVWNSGASQVMRIHVASGKSEGVTCFDQNNSPHADYCPAFGVNISAIFADDLNKSIKNVNLALGNEIITINNEIVDIKNNMSKSFIEQNDAEYLGISYKTKYQGRGTYLVSGNLSNLKKGDSVNYTNSSDGNMSTIINIGTQETLVCQQAYIVKLNTSNNTATILVTPNNYGLSILHSNQIDLSDKICVLSKSGSPEYRIYNTNIWNTVSQNEFVSKLETKVDKVSGKGLSTNDFTNEYLRKLIDLSYSNSTISRIDIVSLRVGDYISQSDIYVGTIPNTDIVVPLEMYTYYEPMHDTSEMWLGCNGEPIAYSDEYVHDSKLWSIKKVDNFSDYDRRHFQNGITTGLADAEYKIKTLQSTITALEARIAALEAK